MGSFQVEPCFLPVAQRTVGCLFEGKIGGEDVSRSVYLVDIYLSNDLKIFSKW